MPDQRPFVLSLAGFDPCGGAGILADIKTVETHEVYGLGVCTALTIQNENTFTGVRWICVADIQAQLDILFTTYSIHYVKIGLIENLDVLNTLVDHIVQWNATVKIVWDPILRASAGFCFHAEIAFDRLNGILKKIYLVTPNLIEVKQLAGLETPSLCAEALSQYCAVYLKDGHGTAALTKDYLFQEEHVCLFEGPRTLQSDKHGSGCVLASAITANLAKGSSLPEACRKAKAYTAKFLTSNTTLLGYHNPSYV